MNVRWLLLLALGPLATTGGAGKNSKDKDLAAMQGDWALAWLERRGEKIPIERPAILTIRGKKYLYGKRELLSLKIDPGFSPKLIDLTILAPEDEAKGTTLEGIYKIEGDTMVWCFYAGEGVKQRPLEFRTAPGSGLIIHGFKRAKR